MPLYHIGDYVGASIGMNSSLPYGGSQNLGALFQVPMVRTIVNWGT